MERTARGICAAFAAAALASCASVEVSGPFDAVLVDRPVERMTTHRLGFREVSALVCVGGRPRAFHGSLRGWSFSAPTEAFASATLDLGRLFARAADRAPNRDRRLDAAARERVVEAATGPRSTLGCPENPAPVSRIVLRMSDNAFAALVPDDAATVARESRRRRAVELLSEVRERCPRAGGGDRICVVGGGASATPLLIADAGPSGRARSAVCATEAAFVCELVKPISGGVSLLHQFDGTRTSLAEAAEEAALVADALRAMLGGRRDG